MPVFLEGHHLITPSAAVATGTGSSATINANGSVSFTSAATLQLEGVFSADYDNYQIVCRMTKSTSGSGVSVQVVSGSTPNATSNYIYQELSVAGTSIAGSRSSGTFGAWSYATPTQPGGFVAYIYGPYLSQPTVSRSVSVDGLSSVTIQEYAWSHNVSSAFDGFKLDFLLGTCAGRIAVYGMVK